MSHAEMRTVSKQRRKAASRGKGHERAGKDFALVTALVLSVAFLAWHLAPVDESLRQRVPSTLLLLAAGAVTVFVLIFGDQIVPDTKKPFQLSKAHRSGSVLVAAVCILLTLFVPRGDAKPLAIAGLPGAKAMDEAVKQREVETQQAIAALREEIKGLKTQPASLSAQDKQRLDAAEKSLAEAQKKLADVEAIKKAMEEVKAKPKASEPPPIAVQPTKPPAVPSDSRPVEELPAGSNNGGAAGTNGGGNGKANPSDPPPTDAEKKAALGALAAIAALAFPELAPIFMALGIDLGLALGGTEVRDLPTIGKTLTEVYSAAEIASTETLIKKICDDTTYGNPTAALDQYLDKLNDPIFRKRLGEQKTKELLEELRAAKMLWEKYPNAMYYCGREKTKAMLAKLSPMIATGNEAEFGQYASATPDAMISLANWKTVLTEALIVAKRGGLTYSGGALKPVPAAEEETLTKFRAILNSKPVDNSGKAGAVPT